MDRDQIAQAKKLAAQIRVETAKQFVHRGFGHIGGCFSATELLAVLYSGVLRVDCNWPDWPERDRLVVSKGHAGPAVYSALALKGFFPLDWLETLNEGGTRLPSHCDRFKTPGIDFSTGSLGQGLSMAVGVAYGFALDSKKNDVFVLVGDGEIQEGQIWEAAMAAGKYALDHLYCFVDANKYQIDGSTDEIMPLLSIEEKFRAFGWHVQQIDGHDVASIFAAIMIARAIKGKPCAIVLDTVKGYGAKEISEMKNLCHHMSISAELGERLVRGLKQDLQNCN